MQFPFLFFCDHFRNFLWQLNLKREFQKKNFGMIFFWGHVYVELRVSLQVCEARTAMCSEEEQQRTIVYSLHLLIKHAFSNCIEFIFN